MSLSACEVIQYAVKDLSDTQEILRGACPERSRRAQNGSNP